MSGSKEGTDTTTSTADSTGRSKTGTTGTSATTGSTTGKSATDVTMADWVNNYIQSSKQTGANALSGYESALRNFQLDPTSMQALNRSAAGDFLYGGQAQQAYVDAAQRAAMPGIASMFGGKGSGTGGLAQVAVGQAGIDSYAGLYNQERDRMQQAAQSIPGIQMLPFQLQKDLFNMASSVPSSYSSLFGTSGTQATSTNQRTDTTGKSTTDTREKRTGSETTPTHEDPSWYKWADLAAMAAGAYLNPAGTAANAATSAAGKKDDSESSSGFLSSLLGRFR